MISITSNNNILETVSFILQKYYFLRKKVRKFKIHTG